MKKLRYDQLTFSEREQIHFMLWDKVSIREIARKLKRSPSTVSREVNRNTPPLRKRYTPHLAQMQYKLRKKVSRERPRLKDPKLVNYMEEKLTQENWSPEQIAGRWNRTHTKTTISHEAIYQYIYATAEKNDLRPYLRRKHKRRIRKKVPFKELKTTIPNRIPIDFRPRAVEARRQLGHWEGDSIESPRTSKAGLNVLNERKSKLVRISKLTGKTAKETSAAVIGKLKNYPLMLRRTLTLDNGIENADHQEVTKQTQTDCYFADPYRSNQRGTCENTNGLIRYYFPKGTDFATVTEEEIARVEKLLNNRPRKTLKYQTPLEVFGRGCCT